METSEIFASLKTEKATKECFNHVYPIDKLPDKADIRYNCNGESFLVVNLDPSYKSGSHWVALCISPAEYIADEYFDSYGLPPCKKIKEYLDERYLFSKKQLQSFTSTVCGQWCIFYIWKRCQGFRFGEILAMFKNSTPNENDEYINKAVNQHFVGRKQKLLDVEFFYSQSALSFNQL